MVEPWAGNQVRWEVFGALQPRTRELVGSKTRMTPQHSSSSPGSRPSAEDPPGGRVLGAANFPGGTGHRSMGLTFSPCDPFSPCREETQVGEETGVRNQGQRWLAAALRHSTHRHPSGSWKSSLSLLPIRALQERAQGQRVGPDSSQQLACLEGRVTGQTEAAPGSLEPTSQCPCPEEETRRGGRRKTGISPALSGCQTVSQVPGREQWTEPPPLPALQDGIVPLHRGGSESHSVVSDSLRPHGLYGPRNSPGQNTRVGSLSLLQGIFPTQGSNPGLPHCR